MREENDALRQNDAKYRSLFENSLDAIFLALPNGAVTDANPAARALLGMSREEILHAGRAGIIDESDPNLPAMLEERARTGRFRGEVALIRKDGTKFPVEISSVTLHGKVVTVLCHCA